MLQAVAHMLFVYDIRDLSGVAKEIKILAHVALARSAFAKSVVIEVVAGFLKLVTQAIVGIIEV